MSIQSQVSISLHIYSLSRTSYWIYLLDLLAGRRATTILKGIVPKGIVQNGLSQKGLSKMDCPKRVFCLFLYCTIPARRHCAP